jgi:transposase
MLKETEMWSMRRGQWELAAVTVEQQSEIEAVLRRFDLKSRVRERLEMVKAASQGYDLEAIATWSSRSPRTVRCWLDRFAVAGVEALDDAPRAGRPVRADAAYRQALEAVETPPRSLGLAFDVPTSARLSSYLEKRTGVRIAPGWIRALLGQLDFVSGRPKHTLTHLQDPDAVAASAAEIAAAKKIVARTPEGFELHYEDEIHLETNPYLTQVWHRRGIQPTVPAVGMNRRVTFFGSVEALGRGRVEVVRAGQNSACFSHFLDALDARHLALGVEIYLVLDNGPCHTSRASTCALQDRKEWLHVIWLAKYSPELNQKEHEWRVLKRNTRGHLSSDLRSFVDEIVTGLHRLGGTRRSIIDRVPSWFIEGHRVGPTGHERGRPAGSKESYQRSYTRKNLPAPT